MTRELLMFGLATVVGLTTALFDANEVRVIGTVVDGET